MEDGEFDKLAIEGGPKVRTGHLPKWPSFSSSCLKKIKGILDSGNVNYWGGKYGKLFEETFAEWIGLKSAVALSNGTAALHLALESLGIGKGDEVVCTPYSFRASATAAANVGAKMVFADVGQDHMLNAQSVENVLTPKTKAVIVVHLYGQVADMGPLMKLARKYSFKVIEDCAQCLGGEYKGRKVGTIGDVGCFSFCQNKHITSGGEGGMLVSRLSTVVKKARSLRDHGWVVGSHPKAYDTVGYNFRITEIQSAIALEEFSRLEKWNLARRRNLSKLLIDKLSENPIVKILPVNSAERRASFYLVPFVLDENKLKVPVSKFIDALQAENVCAYKILWPLMAKKPVAAYLIKNTVGFWVHPVYAKKEILEAVRAFNKVSRVYAKWNS
jgi:dTDP-4-amino-4,6-dideoxygalactose transaminase